MSRGVKETIYTILSPTDERLGKDVSLLIMSLIVISIISTSLETVDGLRDHFGPVFHVIEVLAVAVFTIEYLLRLWTCTASDEYSRPVLGRVRYAFTGYLLIDLFAILPFYLDIVYASVGFLPQFRLFRMFRFVRIFKLGRYSDSIQTLLYVIDEKKGDIAIAGFVTFLLLYLSSSLLYYVEHPNQPETFSSIPDVMWWVIVTSTTVGYGDVYPETVLGKVFGALVALLGLGLIALPGGILASGFIQNAGKSPTCPHCGQEINDYQH